MSTSDNKYIDFTPRRDWNKEYELAAAEVRRHFTPFVKETKQIEVSILIQNYVPKKVIVPWPDNLGKPYKQSSIESGANHKGSELSTEMLSLMIRWDQLRDLLGIIGCTGVNPKLDRVYSAAVVRKSSYGNYHYRTVTHLLSTGEKTTVLPRIVPCTFHYHGKCEVNIGGS